ncbi:MAG: hypothetical protein ACLQD8_07845 [Thermoplasmata archaeon]
MSADTVPAIRPRSEAELVRATARYLETEGYRVYIDPDGTDYFDLAARRGAEVGLVEAKLSRPRDLLVQALRRRPWADWVAVVVPSPRMAARLVASTAGRRADPVGIWVLERGAVSVVRAARPFARSGMGDDPFAAHRDRFRKVLGRIDRGEVPEGIRWDGLARELRRASGGRGFREWRLDEELPEAD